MLAPLLVWVIILLFVFPIYLLAVIVFGFWRIVVNFIVWKWKPDLVAHFTSRDLAFTSDDFEGNIRKTIINVTVLKGSLDIDVLREGVKHRLLNNPFCFKMHCRPLLYMGYWFWQRTEVNVNSHVFEHNRIRTDDELKTFLPAWGAQKYVPDCPLWAVMLVRLDKGRCAIVTKYHHMLGDGVSFMRLLEYLCDGGWVHLQTAPVKSMSPLHWAYAWFTFPWNALKSYRLARIRKGFRPNIYCGEGLTSWTEIPMEKIRVIRRASNCLFQSAMGGIMSNAFHRLLESTGKSEMPTHIRMVIPIPYPNRTDKTLTNHFAWLHSEMEVGGGQQALLQFDQNIKDSYKLGMHGVMWEFFRAMYLVPGPLLKRYTTWGEVNIPPVLFSSVPGTLGQVSILGLEVLQSYPILALGCSMGVNATVTTYKDNAHFCIRVSKEVIPNQDMLEEMLQKHLHEEVDYLYHQALAKKFPGEKDSNANNHLQIKVHGPGS